MELKGVWPKMMSLAPCAIGLLEQVITDLQKDLCLCDQRPFAEGLAHSPQDSATNDIVRGECSTRC